MSFADAIRDRIQFYMTQKNMKPWDLFKATGVPISTICAILNGQTNLPKLDTLLHICEGFGITITEFFESDIFKEVEQD